MYVYLYSRSTAVLNLVQLYYILCIILACVLGTKFSTIFTAVVMGTRAAAKVLNLVPWKAPYEYRHEWP